MVVLNPGASLYHCNCKILADLFLFNQYVFFVDLWLHVRLEAVVLQEATSHLYKEFSNIQRL